MNNQEQASFIQQTEQRILHYKDTLVIRVMLITTITTSSLYIHVCILYKLVIYTFEHREGCLRQKWCHHSHHSHLSYGHSSLRRGKAHWSRLYPLLQCVGDQRDPQGWMLEKAIVMRI